MMVLRISTMVVALIGLSLPTPARACGFGHIPSSTLNMCLETAPGANKKQAVKPEAMKAAPATGASVKTQKATRNIPRR